MNTKKVNSKKFCSKCKKNKKLDEFSLNHNTSDGKGTYCKQCANEYNAKWKKENPEKAGKYHYYKYDPNKVTYLQTNPKEWYAYFKKYKNERYKTDPTFRIKQLASQAVSYQKRKDPTQINQPNQCSCCNAPTEKLFATFSKKTLEKLEKINKDRPLLYTDLQNNIIWKCSKCLKK